MGMPAIVAPAAIDTAAAVLARLLACLFLRLPVVGSTAARCAATPSAK
jgi:hypothetical protein